MMKKKSLAAFAAAGIALALTGCSGSAAGGPGGGPGGGGDDSEPIRVAIVSPHSGPYADFGALQREGFQFAADEANEKGGIGGRKVEIFVADNLGTAEGSVAAAERLIQQNNARFIMGTVSTPNTMAIMQRLSSWDALGFGVQSQGNDLTGKSCNPRFFRTNMSDHIDVGGLVTWLKENPVSDWDQISADYSFGRDSAEGLDSAASENGWTVEESLFAPLGTTDYAPYIAQLQGGEGLLVNLSGGDSVNFFKQALTFDTISKYDRVIGNTALTNSSLTAVNSDELVGLWGTANWGRTVDTPETAAFVEAFTEKVGHAPADFTGAAYMAMQTLFAGVEKAGSVDPVEVGTALKGHTFQTIKGEVTMRAEDNQMAAPMYIGQVEKTDDGYDLVIKQAMPISDTMPDPDPTCQMGEL